MQRRKVAHFTFALASARRSPRFAALAVSRGPAAAVVAADHGDRHG
jgi:hypothetical protein